MTRRQHPLANKHGIIMSQLSHTSTRIVNGVVTRCLMLIFGGGALLLTCASQLEAQSRNSQGRDFLLTFLPNFHSVSTHSFDSLYIYIASEKPTAGSITYFARDGRREQQNFSISDPNEVFVFGVWYSEFELEGFNVDEGPRGRTTSNEASQDERVAAQSFRIRSDEPITVYGLNYAHLTSDAFLALPVPALGLEYVVMSYSSDGSSGFFGTLGNNSTPSQFAVIAAEDNTEVTIVPAASTRGAGTAVQRVTLQAGEVYLVQARINRGALRRDLTGSRVVATKPVAVFAGHQRARVPVNGDNAARDHLVQHLLPLATWGRSAILTPHPRPISGSRNQNDLYRVLAAYDDTEVFINGELANRLDAGEYMQAALSEAAHVTASGPILVAQFEESTPGNSGPDGRPLINGDPFFMLIPPSEQYLESYRVINAQVIDRADILDRPAFEEQFITVIVPASHQQSVRLDGRLTAQGQFQAVPGSPYVYAHFSVEDGVHTITADTGVGVSVQGYGPANSYGYIGGIGLRDLAVRLAAPTELTICEGEATSIDVQVGNLPDDPVFRWSPATGLSDPTVLKPIANPSETTRYTLSVTGANRPAASTSIVVSVLPRRSLSMNLRGSTRSVLPGEQVQVLISLPDGVRQLSTSASTQSLRVVVEHDPAALQLRQGSAIADGAFKNWRFSIETPQPRNRIIITGTGANVNSSSATLQFSMDAFAVHNEDLQTTISMPDVRISPPLPCVTLTAPDQMVQFSEFCLRVNRAVTLSPFAYRLRQNAPNPVRGVTSIDYAIAMAAQTRLVIVNTLGEVVLEPVNRFLSPGRYSVEVAAESLPAGLYFYKLQSGPFTATRRMLIQQ